MAGFSKEQVRSAVQFVLAENGQGGLGRRGLPVGKSERQLRDLVRKQLGGPGASQRGALGSKNQSSLDELIQSELDSALTGLGLQGKYSEQKRRGTQSVKPVSPELLEKAMRKAVKK